MCKEKNTVVEFISRLEARYIVQQINKARIETHIFTDGHKLQWFLGLKWQNLCRVQQITLYVIPWVSSVFFMLRKVCFLVCMKHY